MFDVDVYSNVNMAVLGEIPASLGRLTNLTSLRLKDNQLSGAWERALRMFLPFQSPFLLSISLRSSFSFIRFSSVGRVAEEFGDTFVAGREAMLTQPYKQAQ